MTDYGGVIDLLSIDAESNLVVVELMRDCASRDITAQAFDYACAEAEPELDPFTEPINRSEE